MVFSAVPREERAHLPHFHADQADGTGSINEALRREGDAWERRILERLGREQATVFNCTYVTHLG